MDDVCSSLCPRLRVCASARRQFAPYLSKGSSSKSCSKSSSSTLPVLALVWISTTAAACDTPSLSYSRATVVAVMFCAASLLTGEQQWSNYEAIDLCLAILLRLSPSKSIDWDLGLSIVAAPPSAFCVLPLLLQRSELWTDKDSLSDPRPQWHRHRCHYKRQLKHPTLSPVRQPMNARRIQRSTAADCGWLRLRGLRAAQKFCKCSNTWRWAVIAFRNCAMLKLHYCRLAAVVDCPAM